MRVHTFLPALLLLCALAAQAAADTGAAELSLGEEAPVEEKAPPDISEYNNVPTGLLAPPDSETKTTETAAPRPTLPAALGHIPGVYVIPGVTQKQDEEEEQGALSFDQILSLYRQGKYARILGNLKPMAEAGNHDAQQLLGIMYMNGQGMAQDYRLALEFLKKAADGNKALAQHYLGVMYFKGLGMEQPDSIKGLMWLHIAILHYPPGPEKERAMKDRDGAYLNMTRLEKNRALQLARDWLDDHGEAHLLDMQQ